MKMLCKKIMVLILSVFMLLSFSMFAFAETEEITQQGSAEITEQVNEEHYKNNLFSENGRLALQAESLSVTSSLTVDAASSDPTGQIVVKVSNRTGNSYNINWKYTYTTGQESIKDIYTYDSYFNGSEVVFVISVTGAYQGVADISFTVTNKTSGSTVGTAWCRVNVTAPTLTVTPSDIVIDLNYSNTATVKAVISNLANNSAVELGFGSQSSKLSAVFGKAVNNGSEIIITGNTPGTYYFNIGMRNTKTGYVMLEKAYKVTVKEKVTVSSISVYQNPSKTVYQVGDTFDTSGLKIKVNYSDGTYQVISNGFTATSPDLSTSGRKTVTVSYGGKSTSFQITVNNKPATLSSISVYMNPIKTVYQVGDTFSSNGLVIKAIYSDGTYQLINSGLTVSEPDMSSAGQKTVTVSYGGKTASFKITVNAATPQVIKAQSVDIVVVKDFDGTKTATLGIAVNPSNAQYSNVKWTSSNTLVATVDANGVVTTTDVVGESSVTVTITNYDGTTVSDSVKITTTSNGTNNDSGNSGGSVGFFDAIINFFISLLDFLMIPFTFLFGLLF